MLQVEYWVYSAVLIGQQQPGGALEANVRRHYATPLLKKMLGQLILPVQLKTINQV